MNHKRSPAADSGQESFVFQEIKRFQHRLARHAETLRKLILGRQATAHRKDALLQFPDKGIVNVFVFCGCVHSSSLRYYRLLILQENDFCKRVCKCISDKCTYF